MQKRLGDQNAVRRILESLEPQQQLRDDQLINHQLPNNRLGTKVSAQEAGGVAVLMLTMIARSFKELLNCAKAVRCEVT